MPSFRSKDLDKLTKATILHIIPDERLGGPQWRSLQVAKHLKDDGFVSIVATPEGDKTFANLLNECDIPCYQIKNFKKLRSPLNLGAHLVWLLFFIPSMISLIRLIKRNRVTIVYTVGSPMYLQGPIAAKLSGAKLVWLLEDVYTPKWIKGLLLPFLRFLPDEVAVVAEAVREYYLGNNTSKNTALLHPPVDTTKFHPDYNVERYRGEFKLKPEEKVIGIVGNINPLKGYEYFFPAAKLIKAAFPNIRFLVVGKRLETQEKYWRRLQALIANLEIEADLILTGSRIDIPQMMNLMDIFVLASVSEAAPAVVLEAMACAKPIVATRVGGVPELIIDGETGILVPSKDSKAIAEAVLYLLNHPEEARRMGIKGRERAIKLFDITRCIQRHKELYHTILNI